MFAALKKIFMRVSGHLVLSVEPFEISIFFNLLCDPSISLTTRSREVYTYTGRCVETLPVNIKHLFRLMNEKTIREYTKADFVPQWNTEPLKALVANNRWQSQTINEARLNLDHCHFSPQILYVNCLFIMNLNVNFALGMHSGYEDGKENWWQYHATD